MCGAGGQSQWAPDGGCCVYVYDEDPSHLPTSRPASSPPHFKGFECVCFYVPSSEVKNQKPHYNKELQTFTKTPGPVTEDLPVWGNGVHGLPAPSTLQQCGTPARENYAIPYPRPAPSVELRGGQVYSGCQCVKRDGLQHDCPRTGCQGKDYCLAYPAPQCVPSGNAPLPEPSETRRRERRSRGARDQGAPQRGPRGYNPPGDDGPYVRKGRQGYQESPPVVPGPHPPCREHRKPRC